MSEDLCRWGHVAVWGKMLSGYDAAGYSSIDSLVQQAPRHHCTALIRHLDFRFRKIPALSRS